MTVVHSPGAPHVFRRSHTKLWMRSGKLAVFGSLFDLALARDVASGLFSWSWGLIIFVPCLAVGFWLSSLVPMQVYPKFQCITLSFDRLYFGLILFLVAAKFAAGRISSLAIWADVAMCIILGLMIGRLGGIGLWIRALKIEHAFRPQRSGGSS